MRPIDEVENLGLSDSDIAIVGMALRTPGARNRHEFWDNLRNGVSSIRKLSREELDAAGESPARYNLPNYVPFTADLPDMEMFDADFFGLSPKDAAIMDPQHRHFLECAWEALEDAARPPESLAGPTGVFAGCGMGSYFYFNVCSHRELVDQTGMFLLRHTGNDKDFLATRASFLFDLQGPSINVQTACSTSLVAVHAACQSLLAQECDMALAGGVTIDLPHRRGYLFQEGEVLSPDGCCRAFDHRAAGTVFGSGVGVVVLRRLKDALADGDPIHAVIKATAINNDGRDKAGYLAPSVSGQAKVIVEAQALAGVSADTIRYVECHGTGTSLGDPIEIEALTQAFRENTKRTGFCSIGSVKTNIGHLDTAAGVVGLIKAALALEHEEMPASLGFEKPNQAINFAMSPFVVNDRLTPWPTSTSPRRAAVNSLGVGGTNAHAILQEAPRTAARASTVPAGGPELIVLSAKSRKALDAMGQRLAAELEHCPEAGLSDVAYTAFTGRRHFEHRRVFAARDRAEAVELLRGSEGKRVHTHTPIEGTSGAVFLFPGGGAQHRGMAKSLYEHDLGFRASVDEGLSYLPAGAADEIRSLWLGAEDDADAAERLLSPSRQLPAILIVEVALARLWMRRGLRPTALLGHSMGENAAACVAGVLSFKDAVGLVRLRGELFDEVESGGMLSVAMGATALRQRLPGDLDLASVNAPELCVVSGRDAALTAFQDTLKADGVDAVRVAINIAAHSRLLDPILDRFEAFLQTVTLRRPSIPIVSNITGAWLGDGDACDPMYWVRHLRSTVLFGDGVVMLGADRTRVYIEVGPGKTLSSLVKMQGAIAFNAVINSLPHAEETGADDRVHFLAAQGRAWATGLSVDIAGLWNGDDRERLHLPTYPFQRQRFFLDRVETKGDAASAHAVPAKRPDVADWGYRPAWKRSVADIDPDAELRARNWLVFLDDAGVGEQLVARLRGEGHKVAIVRAADQFGRQGPGVYTLCPEHGRPGYDALVAALRTEGYMPAEVIHLWLLTRDEGFRPGSSFFHRNQERGFFSMLSLAQALGEENLPAIHVTIVSNGLQRIGDKPVLHPDKATILGPARVIPNELPGVTVRAIDIELPDKASQSLRAHLRRRLAPSRVPDGTGRDAADGGVLDLLWDDLHAGPATETIVYYQNRRWLQHYEPLALDRSDEGAGQFKTRGVYLVTGGVGDLALVVSEELARRFQARLALVGRTRLPDRPFWPGYLRMHGSGNRVGQAITAIERLEALGAEVLYLCADVSNPDDVSEAVSQIRASFGSIDGVIHTAGLIQDELLQSKTAESVEAVFAPKIHGTANLAAALEDEALDLFVLFSSTSVETAPAGQIDYVAANAYLNAFAESQAGRQDRRTLALHWGIWSEVGLAARAVRGEPTDGTHHDEYKTVGPLFERWVDEGSAGKWLEGRWGPATHWMLDEHRLRSGEAIWPGTGYLEIAAQAMREYGVDGAFEVQDLVFLRPLHVPDGTSRVVRVRLKPTKGGHLLEIISAAGDGARDDFVLHAQAQLRTLPFLQPAALDLSAIEARCGVKRSSTSGAAFASAQAIHLSFGPRWQVLRCIALGRGEAVAALQLDRQLHADHDAGYRLHPGLLDIATGYAMELIEGYDANASLWVPVSYRVVRVRGPLPPSVRSWARLSDPGDRIDGYASFDVTLFDDAGEVVLEVERLTIKRLGLGFDLADERPGARRARTESLVDPRSGTVTGSASAALAEQVHQGIRPAEGVDALFRALGTGRSQIIVSSMDLHALQQRTKLKETVASADLFERPDLDNEYVAPVTDIEKTVAGFWTELLGVEKIGIHDSFFDIGGHSLIAVRLFRMIRKAYTVDLPISVLFDAPTIAECARLITEAGAVSSGESASASETPQSATASSPEFLHLVAMHGQKNATATPFFLCAGMFGNVLNLRHLALLLGADRPVYGLQARGLYGDHAPHETFEDMARDYCAEIRKVQPTGPYFLGGFSGGGLTAYAIAELLIRQGEEVALLVLLDTPLPARGRLSARDRMVMKMQDLQMQKGAFVKNWVARRVQWEVRRIQNWYKAPEQLSGEQFHDSDIEAAFRGALTRFEVGHYAGRLVLFRPKLKIAYRLSGGRQLDANRCLLIEDNGWSPHSSNLDVIEVPGDHDSMVLEPNVRILAQHLRLRMEALEAGDLLQLSAAE